MGDDGGFQQVVDQLIGIVGVRRILGDGQQVKPEQRALFGDQVVNYDAALSLSRTFARLHNVATVRHRHTEVAICQPLNLAGGVDVANKWAEFVHHAFGVGQVLGPGVIGTAPHGYEYHAHHADRIVDETDAALAKLAGEGGVED